MKNLAMIALLMGSLFATAGCETPGYTADEDARNVSRNINYDLRMAVDDLNDLLMVDPASRMTRWSVQ